MTSQSLAHCSDRTVLIVDADAAVRGSLQFRLELEGYPVRTYASGPDLLEDIDVPETGCLVIDHRPPVMNGLDLLSELRRRKIGAPAILVASRQDASLTAQTAAAGAALIEKPLLNEALLDGIRAAMRCLPSAPRCRS
ncbi:MAG: response regulator [Hyphomicrobiales bacterium]|nr:response regulator [Hyphomicrobiales bacterium]